MTSINISCFLECDEVEYLVTECHKLEFHQRLYTLSLLYVVNKLSRFNISHAWFGLWRLAHKNMVYLVPLDDKSSCHIIK